MDGPLLDRASNDRGFGSVRQHRSLLGAGILCGSADLRTRLSALTLRRQSRALHKGLQEARAAFAVLATGEGSAGLKEITNQLTVAVNFGRSSGRSIGDSDPFS